jgi:hypothetical protein
MQKLLEATQAKYLPVEYEEAEQAEVVTEDTEDVDTENEKEELIEEGVTVSQFEDLRTLANEVKGKISAVVARQLHDLFGRGYENLSKKSYDEWTVTLEELKKR